jgi:hypothetical protein
VLLKLVIGKRLDSKGFSRAEIIRVAELAIQAIKDAKMVKFERP